MLVDLFSGIKAVESSRDFESALRGSYLCSAISFIQPEKEPESWDLNYYNPEKHEIATIRISENGASHGGADAPFKDSVPKKIDMSRVSVTFREAFGIADALRKEKYNQPANKIFASLHAEESEVWSISFILGTMQIMQVKIDAHDRKVLDSKMHNMMQKNGFAI